LYLPTLGGSRSLRSFQTSWKSIEPEAGAPSAKLVSFKPIRLAQRALQVFTDRIVTVADKRVGKPLAEKKGTFDARASDENEAR